MLKTPEGALLAALLLLIALAGVCTTLWSLDNDNCVFATRYYGVLVTEIQIANEDSFVNIEL